tara:strand:- start:2141 stop:2455 length:315 start_codon:yes stop_codon:yes gene_type:complete
MSTLKTNSMRHLDNTSTANIVLSNNGDVTLAADVVLPSDLQVAGNSTLTGTVQMANTLTLTNQDIITMQNFSIGTNGKGNRTVNTSAPSTTSGYSNGDIWYEVA